MNYVKDILLFSTGLAVGSLGAYFLIKKKYEDAVSEDIESVKDAFKKKCDGCTKKYTVHDESSITNSNTIIPDSTHLDAEKTKYGSDIFAKESFNTDSDDSDQQSVDYTKYANRYSTDAEEEFDYEDREYPRENVQESPYMISEQEFSEGCLAYDKIDLEYYIYDDVLVNEDMEIVSDINGTIGTDNILLSSQTNKPVFYIRNEKLSTDYQVTKMRQHYE
jgi:hypothetical protein